MKMWLEMLKFKHVGKIFKINYDLVTEDKYLLNWTARLERSYNSKKENNVIHIVLSVFI